MSPSYVMSTCRVLERLANEALLETPLELTAVRERLLKVREEAYALGVHAGSEESA